MNDLMAELDGEDEEELQDVYEQQAQNVGAAILKEDKELAFNKDDELDLKYDIKTNNQAISDKKRTIENITS